MKIKTLYVCSRCTYRAHHAAKCINCAVPMEKMCLVCNNAETNCHFVSCKRVNPAARKLKKTKINEKKIKKRKIKRNGKRK